MQQTSLLEDHWPGLVAKLSEAIDLNRSARDFGALVRCRNIQDAEGLLRLALLYGPCGHSLRGTAAWAALSGIGTLSDVAVLKRLRGAAGWLEHVAGQLLAARADVEDLPARPLRLTDGTLITGPGGAQWRIHATYDPAAARLTHLEITDLTEAERLARGPACPGEIRIADRNYARLADMRHILTQGGDIILRTGWRKVTLRRPDGGDFDLFAALKTVGQGDFADIDLCVADHAGGPDLPIRLIAIGKAEAAAEREQRRARRRASKTGKKLDPRTLVAARYMLLLTTLPRASYDAERIAALYRLRWQVELAFKRLKSLVHIDKLPAKDKQLARSWLAAHLIIALMTEDFTQDFLDSFP